MPYSPLPLESLALRVVLWQLADPWVAAEQVLQGEVSWGHLPPNLAANMVALANLSQGTFRVAKMVHGFSKVDGREVNESNAEELLRMVEDMETDYEGGYFPDRFRGFPEEGQEVTFRLLEDGLNWNLSCWDEEEEEITFCELDLYSYDFNNEIEGGYWDGYMNRERLVGRATVVMHVEGEEAPRMMEVVDTIGRDEAGDLVWSYSQEVLVVVRGEKVAMTLTATMLAEAVDLGKDEEAGEVNQGGEREEVDEGEGKDVLEDNK